jgi:hypothetical protein
MGTFQRPASRPYFFATSSAEAEEDEDGLSISSVFSLRALTLKLFKLDLEGGIEAQLRILSCPLLKKEAEGDSKAVAIVNQPKVFFLFLFNLVKHCYRVQLQRPKRRNKKISHKICLRERERERNLYVSEPSNKEKKRSIQDNDIRTRQTKAKKLVLYYFTTPTMFSYFQFNCGFFGIYQGVLVPNFLCPLESYGEERGHEVHTTNSQLSLRCNKRDSGAYQGNIMEMLGLDFSVI